jgi:hypothetical protein
MDNLNVDTLKEIHLAGKPLQTTFSLIIQLFVKRKEQLLKSTKQILRKLSDLFTNYISELSDIDSDNIKWIDR